jgi:hypothetical protein
MKSLSQQTETVSSPLTDMLRGACYFFLFLGILALGYVGFVSAGSHVYQAVEMKKLDQAGPLVEPHVLAEGEVIGEIEVPRLGLNAIVVQGDSPASLTRAVGHLSDTALPGEWGNVALAGHRDTFFRPLRDIRVGDGNINGTRPDLAHLLPDLLRRSRAKTAGCSCARSYWSSAGATRKMGMNPWRLPPVLPLRQPPGNSQRCA